MKKQKLTLETGHWYGWQMLPGYADLPYFSPIYISEIEPLKTGKNMLSLTFVNAMYANGVKEFEQTLKILSHQEQFLVADITSSNQNRCAIISEISFSWIKQCVPEIWYFKPPSHFDGLASSECNYYLNTLFLGALRP